MPGNHTYTSTLTITAVQKATDEGEFTCGADNGVGGRKLLDQPYNVFIDTGTIIHDCLNWSNCTVIPFRKT